MAQVKFSDIGKSVSDLLKLDQAPFSLDVSTTAVNGVKLSSSIKRSDATKPDVSGDVRAKYTDKDNGVTFNYSFNTDRKLVAKVELKDQLTKGLNVNAEASIKAEKEGSSSKGIKLSFGYSQEHLATNASVDVLQKDIPVVADVSVGYDGLNAGAEVTYGLGSANLSGYQLAVSYGQPDYTVAVQASPAKGRLDIGQLAASYYHQLGNKHGAGAKLTYNLSNGQTSVAIGTSYILDPASVIKANLDTTGKLGLQYSQKIHPTVKATFTTGINFNGPITAESGIAISVDF